MKQQLFRLIYIFSFTFVFLSCSDNLKKKTEDTSYQCPMKCEGEKIYLDEVSCPVCKMDLLQFEGHPIDDQEGNISVESIFNLTSVWNTQNNEAIELVDLRGDVLVVVMIYTSCKAACPRLVADMRNIYEKVADTSVKYILVSIDPESDTPEKLKAFATENLMDSKQWVFLQGNVDDVRELSNVLAVKYKQISPIDFSHSNIISVFNKAGELYYQQEGLGVDNEVIVSKIVELNDLVVVK